MTTISAADYAAAILLLTPPDPDAPLHVTTLLRALGGLCTLAGCDRIHEGLGLCNMHYLSRYKRAVEAELLAINRRDIAA
jgi:hypothetical protein